MDTNILRSAFDGISRNHRILLGKTLRNELKVALEHLNVEIGKNNVGATGITKITPPIKDMFACFRGIDNINVVLIGQDPFIREGQATGYSFSVPKTMAIPPSTRNIYKCLLNKGLIKESPTHGNLESWAKQGVLLLNAALTTKLGKSNQHLFWHKYTDAIIKELDKTPGGLIYILLGSFAKGKEELITNPESVVLKWGHPSPLSNANQVDTPSNFKYCTCFEDANKALIQKGCNPINWNPDWNGSTFPNDKKSNNNTKKETTIVKKESTVTKKENNNVTKEIAKSQIKQLENKFGGECNPFKIYKSPPMKSRFTADIHVFTDGAAKNNAKPVICTAGWGYYITGTDNEHNHLVSQHAYGNVPRIKSGKHDVHPSNQRGELSGIFNGLKCALDTVKSLEAYYSPEEIGKINLILISDSEYSLKIINDWWRKWVSRGQVDGKKNLDIIRPMMELVDQLNQKVIFNARHVRSHQKEPVRGTYDWFLWYGNEVADKLAVSGIYANTKENGNGNDE